jgi:hypothetical protein
MFSSKKQGIGSVNFIAIECFHNIKDVTIVSEKSNNVEQLAN